MTDIEQTEQLTTEIETVVQHTQPQIENLVFEGGGMKGYAFGGALRKLEELDILKNIKRVAGSSAGSIVAGALAIGASADQVQDILRKTDFKKFQDRSCRPLRWVRDICRFLFKFGWYKGDALYKWFGEVLSGQGKSPDMTFKQVYDECGKELIITGTNVTQGKTVYFHYLTHPDMPIRQAVRISSSLPFIFKAIKMDGDKYIDGGVLNPYPLWVFDNEEQSCYFSSENQPNQKTLGFKLMGSDERPDQHLYHGEFPTGDLFSFSLSIFNNLLWQAERSHIRSGYWERTVAINTFNIKATDFDLNEDLKQKLWDSGYEATGAFFEGYPPSADNEQA